MKWLKSAFTWRDKPDDASSTDQTPLVTDSIRTSSMASPSTHTLTTGMASGTTSTAPTGRREDKRTSSTATSPRKKHSSRHGETKVRSSTDPTSRRHKHDKDTKKSSRRKETGIVSRPITNLQQLPQQNGTSSNNNQSLSRTSSIRSAASFKSLTALSASLNTTVIIDPNVDPAMAAALEQAEAAAARVAELQKARTAEQQASLAAMSKAKESTFEAFLRDIKLWLVELAAAVADVEEALEYTIKRKDRYKTKLSEADPSDKRRVTRIEKTCAQLSDMEQSLKSLLTRVNPVSVAVHRLKELREVLQGPAAPPFPEAQKAKDGIITKLLLDLKKAGMDVEQRMKHKKRHHRKKSKDEDVKGNAEDNIVCKASDIRDMVNDFINGVDGQEDAGGHISRPASSGTEQDLQEASKQKNTTTTNNSNNPFASAPTPPPIQSQAVLGAASISPPPLMIFSPEVTKPHSPDRKKVTALAGGVDPTEVVKKLEAVALADHQEESDMDGSIQNGDGINGGQLHAEPPHTPVLEPCTESSNQQQLEGSTAAKTPQRSPSLFGRFRKSPSGAAATSGGASQRSSSHGTPPQQQQPFVLSSSSPASRTKSSGVRPDAADGIRRVPSMVTLNYELQDNGGTVGRTVAWAKFARENPSVAAAGKTPVSPSSSNLPVPTEDALLAFSPTSLEDVRDFLDAQKAKPVNSGAKLRSKATERWNTLQETSQVYETLVEASSTLSMWIVDHVSGLMVESHRLYNYIDGVAREAGKVAHSNTPLRQRMEKHGIPWDESLLTDVRWAAQYAATELMRFALETHATAMSSPSGTSKGRHSQNLVQQLGHAVIGAFKVHQFAGGFSQAASEQCDKLVELTVHHARAVDPKWVRNSRVA